ncbi:MAG: hypothetical protein P1U80_01525 [Pseudomonadales bacterium]|nr:hypothetical protein [Pseudomonadales bacterium]
MFKIRTLLGACALLVSSHSFAWVSGSGMTVEQVMVHEEGIGRDYFVAYFKKDTTIFRCYVSNTETSTISLILAMHMSKTPAQVHCHDSDMAIGSFSAHKLHRIITNI